MKSLVIVSAVRTPIGKFGGGLSTVPAVELGSHVITAAVTQSGLDIDVVDEVIFGNVLQAGLGQNPARQALLGAGGSESTPAATLNMVCDSGLLSVINAARAVHCGDAKVVMAGGMENMSAAPYILNGARWVYRMGDNNVVDVQCMTGCSAR